MLMKFSVAAKLLHFVASPVSINSSSSLESMTSVLTAGLHVFDSSPIPSPRSNEGKCCLVRLTSQKIIRPPERSAISIPETDFRAKSSCHPALPFPCRTARSSMRHIFRNDKIFPQFDPLFFTTSDVDVRLLQIHEHEFHLGFPSVSSSSAGPVGQVLWCSCSFESGFWDSCPVTRSPSCERMHRQTVSPLPRPTCVVSSSTYLFGCTNHDVTASSGFNTAEMRSQQGQKGPEK